MYRVWKQSPLLRALLPFMVGILLQLHAGVNPYIVIAIGVLSLSTLFLIHFRYKIKFAQRFLYGITFAISSLCFGVLLTYSVNPLRSDKHIFNTAPSNYDALLLRLTETPIPKNRSIKVVAEIVGGQSNSEIKAIQGLVLTYFQKDSLSMSLGVDDTVWVSVKPTTLNEPKNPFEFEYKRYLNNHFIFNQLYTPSDKWSIHSKATRHSYRGYFIIWRESLLSILREYGVSGQEYAVLSALVLGKTSDIDYQLMMSYASAGTIHVLAVSGLHVGLVYLILSPLMRLIFPRNRFGLVKSFLPILLLWLYAGITGFSPSVQRAALMFSCFIIADNYSMKNNSYNTMSASALIILLWNPYIIHEIGFQLSYLAVLGIVILQKNLDKIIYLKNKVIRWVWGLIAVSISAQVATFALGLFYFHQFPNYFLVSNLLVIPLSTVILFSTIAFFALSWIPMVATILIGISNGLTWLMNRLMLFIDSMPYSLTDGVSISGFEAFLIFCIAFLMCYWLLWKKPKALIVMLVFVLTLCVSQAIEKKSIVMQREVCIHSIPRMTCITYVIGEEAFIFYTNGLLEDESSKRFYLKNYWDYLGLKEFNNIDLNNTKSFHKGTVNLSYPFLHIEDKRFVFIDSLSIQSLEELQGDYFIFGLSAQSIFFSQEHLNLFESGNVILTHELSKKKKSFLKDNLPKSNIFDLEEGAGIIRENEVLHFSNFY